MKNLKTIKQNLLITSSVLLLAACLSDNSEPEPNPELSSQVSLSSSSIETASLSSEATSMSSESVVMKELEVIEKGDLKMTGFCHSSRSQEVKEGDFVDVYCDVEVEILSLMNLRAHRVIKAVEGDSDIWENSFCFDAACYGPEVDTSGTYEFKESRATFIELNLTAPASGAVDIDLVIEDVDNPSNQVTFPFSFKVRQ
ncbi:hypothetical protein OAU52_00075 [bacterium]|nr:hypothetical protein [bacterium]